MTTTLPPVPAVPTRAEVTPTALCPLPERLARRVAALKAHFEQVRTTRMVGVPLLNAALRVEAVGFQPAAFDADTDGLEGVLITPWFMSLVRLPLQALPHGQRVGTRLVRAFGAERFDFLGAHDPDLGYHETCALFSPMDGFASHDQARDTAEAALALIRQPPAAASPTAPPPRRAFFKALVPSASAGA